MPAANHFTHHSTTVALVVLTLTALQAAPSTAQHAPLPQNSYSTQSLQPVLNPLDSGAPTSNLRSLKSKLYHGYGSLPLSFEANKGQVAAPVKFVSRGSGYSLSLTSTEAVFNLRQPAGTQASGAMRLKSWADDNATSAFADGEFSPRRRTSRIQQARTSVWRSPDAAPAVLRMRLANAKPTASRGEAMLPGRTNYLIGRDRKSWHTGIPTYQKVRYTGVYPGVDLVYYGDQRQLEYDFIVAPKANPGMIALKFDGAKSLTVDKTGDLVVGLAGRAVRWHKPVVYQQVGGARKSIAGRYRLKGRDQVAFALGNYDRSKPLVIDPVFVYATYLGGSAQDTANAVALDNDGNAYVCGTTYSDDLIGTTDPSGIFPAGFVAKLDPTGTRLVYCTYIGTAVGAAIAVDSTGHAYIVGSLSDNTLPVVNGVLNRYTGGVSDAFLMKINPAGSDLNYSTYFGGTLEDVGTGVAVGPDGTAYIAGYSDSTNLRTVNAFQSANAGGSDAFVARIDTAQSNAASLVYSTYLGGSGDEDTGGIAVDSRGRIYVVGETRSVGFPVQTPAAYQGSLNGSGTNAFLTKFSPDGSKLTYSTYFGGTGTMNMALAVAVSEFEQAYITGSTTSTDLPIRNPVQATYTGSVNGFVARFNTGVGGNTSLVYSTYLGTTTNHARSIAIDVWGNAYITGDVFENGQNAFVAKIAPVGGKLLYGFTVGGVGTGIAVNPQGDAVVVGQTVSASFPVTPGAIQTRLANAANGPSDAFVFRLPTYTKLDLNSDTMPDLLFQNTLTGQLAYWLMQGDRQVGVSLINPSLPGINWKAVGSGDLNGDGSTDLVFQDINTGDLIHWRMNGVNQSFVEYFSPKNPGANWNVVGVTDINRDGYPDLVFQNSVSGDIYVWYMQGTTQIGGAYINPKNPGAGWKVAAVGDLNADGQADLVFQNSTSGNVYVWYMHSDTQIGGGFLSPANPGAGWNVAGLVDFIGQGKPQIVFQNGNTGQMAYWVMNGLSLDYFDLPKPNNPGQDWKLVGAR